MSLNSQERRIVDPDQKDDARGRTELQRIAATKVTPNEVKALVTAICAIGLETKPKKLSEHIEDVDVGTGYGNRTNTNGR